MPSQDHPRVDESSPRSFLASPAGWVLIGFLAIGGVYIWMEHRAHLFGALVWLPLLLCPLMLLFMHRWARRPVDRSKSPSGETK